MSSISHRRMPRDKPIANAKERAAHIGKWIGHHWWWPILGLVTSALVIWVVATVEQRQGILGAVLALPALLATVALLASPVLLWGGYRKGWNWTGFNADCLSKEQQPPKRLWDWMGLLVVPLVLAAGGLWFTAVQNAVQQDTNNAQHKIDLAIATSQRQADEAIALNKTRDDVLDTYMDRMSALLLREAPAQFRRDPVAQDIVTARTITALRRLDSHRNNILLDFIAKPGISLDLTGADLTGADLRNGHLWSAKLEGAYLWDDHLEGAFLINADLRAAHLQRAHFHEAHLRGAYLEGAHLEGAHLSEAHLIAAHLNGARLHGADLRGADLRDADLRGATGVTDTQIEHETRLLTGATLPSGMTYTQHS